MVRPDQIKKYRVRYKMIQILGLIPKTLRVKLPLASEILKARKLQSKDHFSSIKDIFNFPDVVFE